MIKHGLLQSENVVIKLNDYVPLEKITTQIKIVEPLIESERAYIIILDNKGNIMFEYKKSTNK